MQPETKIPLTLVGLEGFMYSKNDYADLDYDPLTQITTSTSDSKRDTVSDCSTTSGILIINHDDEERDVDD